MKKKKKALIIVDVQNDFCPGGALPVPNGDEVVPVINRLLDSGKFDFFVVSLDWHPEDHCSFIGNGGKWPKHCVQCTHGAELHPDLKKVVMNFLHKDHLFVAKGIQKEKEAYSAFNGNVKVEKLLKERNNRQVYVCGLATDYCVKATAIDSQKEGFETFVIIDACRGVAKETSDAAIEEMKAAGIKILKERQCLSFLFWS